MSRAADDFDTIHARMKEIAEERIEWCPVTHSTPLYNCLRSMQRCGAHCPLRDSWIGPETPA